MLQKTTNQYDKTYFIKSKYEQSVHNEWYFQILSKNIKGLRDRKLLDIGCAYGYFLKNSNHKQSLGLDISNFAIKRAKELYPTKKFKVFDINMSTFQEKGYEVITIFDVIEHLYDLMKVRRLIDSNLENKGYLVVTTPNAHSLLKFISPKDFTGEKDPTHTILFTPYTLDFFLKRMGLVKIKLFTPFSFHRHDNWLTNHFLFGGQIFAIYQKL